MDGVLDKRPDSAVQRFAAKNSTANEGPVTSRDHVMLDVQTLRQGREAFSYHYLTKVKFNAPGDAPDTLRLYFADDVVTVRGRRLGKIYEELTLHLRRNLIEQGDVFEKFVPEDAPVIEQVTIEEAEDDSGADGQSKRR